MAILGKNHNFAIGVVVATVGILAVPIWSHAAGYSFTSGSTTGSGFGNSVQRSSGGVDVTVTGWSLDNLSGAFQSGQIKIWSSGLGVCNRNEPVNCSDPTHPVDNSSGYDFLLFSFSETVLLDNAVLTAWASDFDATLWAGTGDLVLTHGITTMASAGLGSGIEDLFGSNNASPGNTTRIVDLASRFPDPADWFLIGASLQYTGLYDLFTFKELTMEAPPPGSGVPEPTTAVLLGTGLIGVFVAKLFMKRRPEIWRASVNT